jgi:hypothetical protein
MMQDDYYSVLARMIAATMQDENQLRRMVYELARQKLRRQLYLQYQHLPRPEMEDQLLELEAAITQLEADAAQEVPLLSLPRQDGVNGNSGGSTGTDLVLRQSSVQATVLNANLVEILGPAMPAPVQLHRVEPAQPLPALAEIDAPYRRPAWSAEAPRGTLWLKTQIVGAVLLGVLIFGLFDRRTEIAALFGAKPGPSTAAVATNQPAQTASQLNAAHVVASAAARPDPGFPVPSSYGVYALDQGKLAELNSLPIRVPDARVAISGVITIPTSTTLPDGRVQFVVFRRNLMNDAPDKVTVRVIAQVMRVLSFTGGKATSANVDGSWAVRSNSYDMKVAPVEGNPEMIVIRPQSENFALPAGRYALVLKTAAYDFTIAGAVTDPTHCLERTDALDTQIYSECRRR